MAVIYRCDLCSKMVIPRRNGENPLHKRTFDNPHERHEEYGILEAELCDDCAKEMTECLKKAMWEFYKSKKWEGGAE